MMRNVNISKSFFVCVSVMYSGEYDVCDVTHEYILSKEYYTLTHHQSLRP
jgi:hypothetical protein